MVHSDSIPGGVGIHMWHIIILFPFSSSFLFPCFHHPLIPSPLRKTYLLTSYSLSFILIFIFLVPRIKETIHYESLCIYFLLLNLLISRCICIFSRITQACHYVWQTSTPIYSLYFLGLSILQLPLQFLSKNKEYTCKCFIWIFIFSLFIIF